MQRISSKKDYLNFLAADRIALGRKRAKPKIFGDEIWKFQRAMRKLEYLKNCRRDPIGKLLLPFAAYRFHQLSLKCGFTIACNTFGPGLAIVHRGTIVVNSKTKIGSWCRIHACVNIGAAGGESDAVPEIGDRVYIGPGAKIFGRITIADGVAIGANSVVNRSVEQPNVTVAGVPAKVINHEGSKALIKVIRLEGAERDNQQLANS